MSHLPKNQDIFPAYQHSAKQCFTFSRENLPINLGDSPALVKVIVDNYRRDEAKKNVRPTEVSRTLHVLYGLRYCIYFRKGLFGVMIKREFVPNPLRYASRLLVKE